MALQHPAPSTKEAFLKKFGRLSFFTYLDTYTDIIRFLKFLVIALAVLVVLCAVLGTKTYIELQQQTQQLVQQANAVTTYLRQQKIVDLKILAARIAAEYYSLSYFNSKYFKKNLQSLIYPSEYSKIVTDIDKRIRVIEAEKIIQQVVHVEYTQIHVSEDDMYDGRRMYLVTIPMQVRLSKEEFSQAREESFTFGLYVVEAEPTLGNPFGVYLLRLGKVVAMKALKAN